MSGTSINAVDRIAEFVLGSHYDDVPAQALASADLFLADTISVGISGSVVDSATRVLRCARDWGQGDVATVLGSGDRLPSASAAFVNSFQIHCQEFDCLHEGATVHAMAVLGGALLAAAEEQSYSGREIRHAVALGVDVASNLGLAASGGLRFFRPATAGTLGATAALARLEGFDGTAFRDAWGLAYSQLAGTMQAHVEGSVALPLQVAAAARAAVNSIQLVRNGLSGPHDILEGPFGYFRLFEDGGDLEAVLQNMGQTWRVSELSHKPFPTGRAAHGTLEGMIRLRREQTFEMDDIVAVNAHVPPLVKRLVARPVTADMDISYARLCLQYLVPVLMRNDRIDTTSFSDTLLRDSDILAQGSKVRVSDDGNPDPNALRPQQLDVELRDGTRLEYCIPHTLGSPQNPLTSEQRREKFSRCLGDAGIAGNQVAKLRHRLENMHELKTAAELLPLCCNQSQ
jgi:2-methylcitrate dehydratase PrpD